MKDDSLYLDHILQAIERIEAGWVPRPPDLQTLVREGTLRMAWSDTLLASPPPLPPATTFDRVEGMLLGLAIGDALGNTTEGLVPSAAARCRRSGCAASSAERRRTTTVTSSS